MFTVVQPTRPAPAPQATEPATRTLGVTTGPVATEVSIAPVADDKASLHRELLAAMGCGCVSTASWLAALCANAIADSGTRASGACALDIATLFVLCPPQSTRDAITYVDVTSRHHGLPMTPAVTHRTAVAVMSGLGSAVPHRPHSRGAESTASLFPKGH